MKRFTIDLAILAFIWVVILSVICWAVTAHAATPKIYGVNYGHNFAGKTYSASQASRDLDELKAAGVQAVRVYIANFGTSEVDFTKQLAVLAKSKGMVVTWGVCTGGSISTPQGWQNFVASLDGYAQWANANKIDYFTLGNEEELNRSGVPDARLQSDIRNKAAAIKAAYPTLKLTYATAAEPKWISNWTNTGQLDQIGFNLYVAFTDLTNQIKTNPKAVISEWNTDDGINWARGSQSRWARELVKDRNIINNSGLKAYLFVIRGNGGGIDGRYQLWNGNTRTQAWRDLITK